MVMDLLRWLDKKLNDFDDWFMKGFPENKPGKSAYEPTTLHNFQRPLSEWELKDLLSSKSSGIPPTPFKPPMLSERELMFPDIPSLKAYKPTQGDLDSSLGKPVHFDMSSGKISYGNSFPQKWNP